MEAYGSKAPECGRDKSSWYWIRNVEDNYEQILFFNGFVWVFNDSVVDSERLLLQYQIGPRIPFADELVERTMTLNQIALDVSLLEKARVLHRVWRALNDGDCPKCHQFNAATDIHRSSYHIQCPMCGFSVYLSEIEAIEKLFAPAMDAAVKIFEGWREEQKAKEAE